MVAAALVGQEALLNAFGTNPSLTQTAYRMLVWTIGVTSLALLILPRRRIPRAGEVVQWRSSVGAPSCRVQQLWG